MVLYLAYFGDMFQVPLAVGADCFAHHPAKWSALLEISLNLWLRVVRFV
jgi:hypothetical protein